MDDFIGGIFHYTSDGVQYSSNISLPVSTTRKTSIGIMGNFPTKITTKVLHNATTRVILDEQ
jgi:hypothetical protein